MTLRALLRAVLSFTASVITWAVGLTPLLGGAIFFLATDLVRFGFFHLMEKMGDRSSVVNEWIATIMSPMIVVWPLFYGLGGDESLDVGNSFFLFFLYLPYAPAAKWLLDRVLGKLRGGPAG